VGRYKSSAREVFYGGYGPSSSLSLIALKGGFLVSILDDEGVGFLGLLRCNG